MFKKLFSDEDIDMETMDLAEEIAREAIEVEMKAVNRRLNEMEVKIKESTEAATVELIQIAVNHAVEERLSSDLEEKIEKMVGTTLFDMLAVKKLKLAQKIEELDRDYFYKKGKGLTTKKEDDKFSSEIAKMEEAIGFIDKLGIALEEV